MKKKRIHMPIRNVGYCKVIGIIAENVISNDLSNSAISHEAKHNHWMAILLFHFEAFYTFRK